MLCCRDYVERVVAIFSHQIQSLYYGRNKYVCIEGIALDHFSETTHKSTESTPQACKLHAVFNSLFSEEIKQDSDTTISHSKPIITLF